MLAFKSSSDQQTPLTGCFRRNQSLDLQIKMHVLLIYEKSLKNNFSSFFSKYLSREFRDKLDNVQRNSLTE